MAMASLDASLLARKGSARPVNIQQPTAADQTVRLRFIPQHTPPTSALARHHQGVFKSQAQLLKKQKSVRLDPATDKDLRMLAASKGVSQQSLMAAAIKDMLKQAYANEGCICRTQ